MPILFGPNYTKFMEAVDLIERGGAISIRNYEEIYMNLNKLFTDKEYLNKCNGISSSYVAENRGASKMIMGNISKKAQ